MSTASPGEALFVDEIRRKAREQRWMGVVVGCLLVAIGVPCFFVSDIAGYGYLAAGGGALSAALFFLASAISPSQFLKVLRTRPASIVWIYRQRGNKSGVAIVVGTDDGKRAQFPVATPMREQLRLRPNHGDAGREKVLIDALRSLAPRATVGFSPDLEKRFLAAPPSLRAQA